MVVKPGIHGIETVMKGLNGKLVEFQISGVQGMRNAAGFLRGEMERTSPRVPVDTGNLRASWFIESTRQVSQGKNRVGVKFGFNANYAIYVHEMVDADFTSPRIRYGPGKGKKRKYTPRQGAGAKFLESALKRNVYKILLIIRDKMTIGGTLK